MTEITGNIHLNFNDIDNINKLIKIFKLHSYEWYLLPEEGKAKQQHWHFYIEDCNITDRHLRRLILKEIPDIKKPIEGDQLNKDGTKKGWERKLKVSQIKPKNPVLTYEEEAELIKCYVFKDYQKHIEGGYFSYHSQKHLTEPLPVKRYQERYYELLKEKQDLHNAKNNKKAKDHREYLKILIEGYNKSRTFMNALGVEELRPHTLNDIIDYVMEDKEKSNKVMNIKQVENTAVTIMIHLDKEFKRQIKRRIRLNIENNYIC